MEFQVLGPLAIGDERQSTPVRGLRQQLLLAALVIHRNRTVTVDQLVEAVWGAAAPSTVEAQLRDQVRRLRRVIGDCDRSADPASILATADRGYRLRVPVGGVDLDRFDAAARAGRAALARGRHQLAARSLAQGLAVWRDTPFAGLDAGWLRRVADTWLDRRLEVAEDLIEAKLLLGQYHAVLAEANELVLANPLRERVRGQLMTALAATGSTVEALSTYESIRLLFARELGVEPCAGLQQQYLRILNGTFAAPSPARAPHDIAPSPASAPRANRFQISVVTPEHADRTARADETLVPAGMVPRSAPLVAVFEDRDQQLIAVGDIRVLVRPQAPPLIIAAVRAVWANGTADGYTVAGWHRLSRHSRLATLTERLLRSVEDEYPAEPQWRATSIAKAFAELSRESIAAIRAMRYRLEQAVAAYARSAARPPTTVFADVLELSTACGAIRDQARQVLRDGLSCWQSDLAAYHAQRHLMDPTLPVRSGDAEGRSRPWFAVLDAGVRHCRAAEQLATEELEQLANLLKVITVLAAPHCPTPGA